MRSKSIPDGGLGIAFKLLCSLKPENFDLSCIWQKYHPEKELQNKLSLFCAKNSLKINGVISNNC